MNRRRFVYILAQLHPKKGENSQDTAKLLDSPYPEPNDDRRILDSSGRRR